MDRKSIETGLSDKQLSAVADLAKTNVYARQSKWKTFRELPNKDKLPFFVQHFLVGTVAVVAAVALVIGLIVFYATRAPSTKLYVASFGLSDYSRQLQDLQNDFAAQYPQEDSRVFSIDSNFVISTSSSGASPSESASADASSSSQAGTGQSALLGGSYLDDSAKLAAMMASGEINVLVGTKPLMCELAQRNSINDPTAVLDSAKLAELGDAVVYQDDLVEGADHAPIGLSLSKSDVWKAKGLPDNAVLGFGNVTKGTEWPLNFVNYLFK